MVRLHDYVDEVLDRLGDLEGVVWNRSEIESYVQDGEDQFTRRTECLFDIHVIENTVQFRNWQTHLERYYASQRPGWIVSDEPFQRTGTNPLGTDGRVGGSLAEGNFTKASEAAHLGVDGGPAENVPSTVTGGRIPDSTVRILRVTYDAHTLKGVSSQMMRRLDVNYETRTGTPAWFVYDKDGLFNIRVVPAATGNATYHTIDGGYGVLTGYDTPFDSVVGTHGVITYIEDTEALFPSGGPYGSISRTHPQESNIYVELVRTGRPLITHPSELPDAYTKYVIYFAMARALKRIGPGHDEKLGDHYASRFDMGVAQMKNKKNHFNSERVGRFGGQAVEEPFGIGIPQPPSDWGYPRR